MNASNPSLHVQIQDSKNHLQSLYYSAYYSSGVSLIALSGMIKNAESKLAQLESSL